MIKIIANNIKTNNWFKIRCKLLIVNQNYKEFD